MPSGILTPGAGTIPGSSSADWARQIRFGNASADYPVYNTLSQKYESAKTGTPWTGQVVGGYASNGKWSGQAPSAAQPVTFDVTKTVKQPEVSAAVTGTLTQQQQQANQTATGFQDFLNQARDINAQSKEQLAKDQAAFDTTKISQQLPANDASYQAEQNRITGEIAGRNKDFATQTQQTIDRLNSENSAYEAAAQAVADRSYQTAMKRNSLYQIGSGTPTSGSGNMTNRYIKAYQDVNIPLQRELSDRRYSQITNIERPYQNQLYGNDVALYGRESGLASDYANRADTTAKFLQNLQMQVAGMSRAQAQNYLTNLGLPLEIGQRIIAGDISNLAGIQRLDELANFYTVQTPFDASRIPQASSYPVSYPNRAYTPNPTPQLPATTNPVVAATATGTLSGVNQDGTPRTNPLSLDYSSWYTPTLEAARQQPSSYNTSSTVPYLDNPYYNYGTSQTYSIR